MADDEKRVFALISAIGTIRDQLRQDIDGLRQIHNRWRDSNGSSINLIAQLTALKSSLGNILDWLNYAISDLHPQLVSDLDVLAHSCGLLVRHVDALNARLDYRDHGAVDVASKLKYSVASRSMERLQQVAQRQNDAVNLLLAACQCTAQAQRKILLHKNRQIRKEDAANLRTLTQSSKLNGACITSLAQLSRFIQWLRLLFHMKIARNDFDGTITPSDEEYEHMAAINRSEAIDRALEREATNLRHETKLVLVGNPQGGKELIMHQLKVQFAEGYDKTEERLKYRPAVYQVVRSLISSITNLLTETGVTLSAELTHDFAILLHELDAREDGISSDAVKAITRIWSCPEFSKLYVRNFEIDFPQYAPYFAQEAPRIAEKDYVPSEADIIRLTRSGGGINETRFDWDELDIHLFNIKGYVPQHFKERWYHQLEDATAVIFTVDVSLYNKPSPERPSESILVHEFEGFEQWVNRPGFANSTIILILNNFTRFVSKMAYAPLEKLFPDYTRNESDPELSARQYILRRFKNMNHQCLSIYSFWVDLDSSDNQHLYGALKKTLSKVQATKAQERAWCEGLEARSESERPSTNGLSVAVSTERTRSRSGGKKR
ncbi:uncharacterized protein J4E78_006450 [Alternaria triticimaculans]|uniref:uncharacterized protein n=1 Tax=Alternaria triticimaculans TaxID=297637 RepID=UPI0020C32730|nr:uncharacterized protein J4E78_006450 [Alternaria triticimaculans]KAI4656561.1 hypothetical protein J4E78_006450 [Alternaria triticimaculans]